MGRQIKYTTEEEKTAARRVRQMKYYNNHRKEIQNRNLNRYHILTAKEARLALEKNQADKLLPKDWLNRVLQVIEAGIKYNIEDALHDHVWWSTKVLFDLSEKQDYTNAKSFILTKTQSEKVLDSLRSSGYTVEDVSILKNGTSWKVSW